jgi:hypothetical protein
MARYRLTAAAVVNDKLCEIGEEIEYDGVPGPHMEPLDAEAKRAAGEAARREEPAPDPGMLAHREERTTPGRAEAPKEDEKKEPQPRGGHRG